MLVKERRRIHRKKKIISVYPRVEMPFDDDVFKASYPLTSGLHTNKPNLQTRNFTSITNESFNYTL